MLRARRSLLYRASIARGAFTRSFSRSAVAHEVQLFEMPSMSPTMQEGGIVEWKFKPGDSFNAGDVLLDIETDKAEISVEAADDGVLAKVLVEAGSKGIAVGKPIAITAEEGDDLNSIDVDALLSQKAETSSKPAEPEPAPESKPAASSSSAGSSSPESVSESSSNKPQSEPVSEPTHGHHGTQPLPAAMRLIHEHHLNVRDIKGSGPYGRITKGDILAHLGKIPKDYPNKEQARFSKLQKMDLSNVQAAPPQPQSSEESATEAAAAKPAKPLPLVTQFSVPLDTNTVKKVAAAQRAAMRHALLSLKPRASVLRDPILDTLTAPTRPPFVVKSAKVQILRAKPVALDVVIEEPPAAQPSKPVEVFIKVLKAELAL